MKTRKLTRREAGLVREARRRAIADYEARTIICCYVCGYTHLEMSLANLRSLMATGLNHWDQQGLSAELKDSSP